MLAIIKYGIAIFIIVFLILGACMLFNKTYAKPYQISFENEESLIEESIGHYYLDRELIVWVNDQMLLVPTGFKTDLASIPTWLRWQYNPRDRSLVRPAILHDYIYANPHGYSRADADNIFFYALETEGNSVYTKYTMYWAVRAFGWRFFKYVS